MTFWTDWIDVEPDTTLNDADQRAFVRAVETALTAIWQVTCGRTWLEFIDAIELAIFRIAST
jgi:hypothetical protein